MLNRQPSESRELRIRSSPSPKVPATMADVSSVPAGFPGLRPSVQLEKDIVVGELLECPDCGSELEVLKVAPPALGEAPETEEDWGE